jgi:hypothetical protein
VYQTPTRRGHMQHAEYERLVTPVAWDSWCWRQETLPWPRGSANRHEKGLAGRHREE